MTAKSFDDIEVDGIRIIKEQPSDSVKITDMGAEGITAEDIGLKSHVIPEETSDTVYYDVPDEEDNLIEPEEDNPIEPEEDNPVEPEEDNKEESMITQVTAMSKSYFNAAAKTDCDDPDAEVSGFNKADKNTIPCTIGVAAAMLASNVVALITSTVIEDEVE